MKGTQVAGNAMNGLLEIVSVSAEFDKDLQGNPLVQTYIERGVVKQRANSAKTIEFKTADGVIELPGGRTVSFTASGATHKRNFFKNTSPLFNIGTGAYVQGVIVPGVPVAPFETEVRAKGTKSTKGTAGNAVDYAKTKRTNYTATVIVVGDEDLLTAMRATGRGVDPKVNYELWYQCWKDGVPYNGETSAPNGVQTIASAVVLDEVNAE